MCIFEGCKTIPVFNIEGKPVLYCSKHKLEGMIDVKNKKCIHHECKKTPNFNIASEKKAIYCLDHKLESMINVKAKTCIYIGCDKQPTYNKKGGVFYTAVRIN